MSVPTFSRPDVHVLGAGIIGLSCALELADRGARVSLVEPAWPPRGASWAAAGMIAPAFEAAGATDTHVRLFDLCLRSAELWPTWSRALEARTGLPTGYSQRSSIALGITDKDLNDLNRITKKLDSLNLPYRTLGAQELPEPVRFGLELPTDTQVDNRMAMTALVQACELHDRIEIARDASGPFEQPILVTAGWRSSDLLPVSLPIFPLSGQMLSLSCGEGDPAGPVRCGSMYIVPKRDRVIIGATVEPGIARVKTDRARLDDLKQTAIDLFPQFDGRDVIEEWVGVRPGTPDHAPYLGGVEKSVFVAAGHHRNGILLAPVTARLIADMILENLTDELVSAFSPLREAAVTRR